MNEFPRIASDWNPLEIPLNCSEDGRVDTDVAMVGAVVVSAPEVVSQLHHRDGFANQHIYTAADLLSSSIARTQLRKFLKSKF